MMLTPEEASALLKVHKRTVLNWIRDKKIQATRISPKVIRIPVEGLRQFIGEADYAALVKPAPSTLLG